MANVRPEYAGLIGWSVAQAQGMYDYYAGFVLISGDAPRPAGIVDSYGPPNVCNTDERAMPDTTTTMYATAQEAADDVGYSVHEVANLPSGLSLDTVDGVRYSTGASYAARLRYSQLDPIYAEQVTSLEVLSIRDFASPFPLWEPCADELQSAA